MKQEELNNIVEEECKSNKPVCKLRVSCNNWCWIPSKTEYERLIKYIYPNDTCPKCKKGIIVLEQKTSCIEGWLQATCKFNEPNCNFTEDISDQWCKNGPE